MLFIVRRGSQLLGAMTAIAEIARNDAYKPFSTIRLVFPAVHSRLSRIGTSQRVQRAVE
jgi:hypothetical protein